ncbi:MAG: hypothetical protein WA865_20270 [Spirulinaceae cyanobacterium]
MKRLSTISTTRTALDFPQGGKSAAMGVDFAFIGCFTTSTNSLEINQQQLNTKENYWLENSHSREIRDSKLNQQGGRYRCK